MVVFRVVLLQLGDVIDVRDEEMGAWFEARIVKILPMNSCASAEAVSQQQQLSESVEASDSGNEGTACNAGNSASTTDTGNEGTGCNPGTGASTTDTGNEGTTCNAGTGASTTPLKINEPADDGFLYNIVFEQSVTALLL